MFIVGLFKGIAMVFIKVFLAVQGSGTNAERGSRSEKKNWVPRSSRRMTSLMSVKSEGKIERKKEIAGTSPAATEDR